MPDFMDYKNKTYGLFALLALILLSGMVTFLLTDRFFFTEALSGKDVYLGYVFFLFLPIMFSSAGALAIFRLSLNALEQLHREREAVREHYLVELERSYRSAMFALVAALDCRDHLSGGHSRRVVAYALAIAEQIGLPPESKRDLAFGGYLHDVGKIGVDDNLLRKSTVLSDLEWVEMRKHPVIGHEILQNVEFLGSASDVVLYHHERFDGNGYPAGLLGEKIPLLARIFTVADAFDAMTTDRPYRKAMNFEQAKQIIMREAGRQFCPKCVKAFLSLPLQKIVQIRQNAESNGGENLWHSLNLTGNSFSQTY